MGLLLKIVRVFLIFFLICRVQSGSVIYSPDDLLLRSAGEFESSSFRQVSSFPMSNKSGYRFLTGRTRSEPYRKYPKGQWDRNNPSEFGFPSSSAINYPFPQNPYQMIDPSAKKKCVGKTNLINDFGIVSLIIGAVSTIVGFTLDLIATLEGTAITALSTFFALLFSIPNAIISFLGISSPFTYVFGNGLNILGFATTFFGGTGVHVGNFGLATGLFFEFLGIIGLILSVFGSFPELLDDFIDFGNLFGFGDELKLFIDNYGCTNPYE